MKKSYKPSQVTKEKLCLILKEKLLEKPLRQITVQEIVQELNMYRQTFYYHYENISDLIKDLFSMEANKVIDPDKSIDENLVLILKYIAENRKLFANTISSLDREIVKNAYYDLIHEALTEKYKKARCKKPLSRDNKEFVIHLMTITIEAVFESWSYEEIDMSAEETALTLKTMFDNLFVGLKHKTK